LAMLKGILRQSLPGPTLPGCQHMAYMRLTMRHDGTRDRESPILEAFMFYDPSVNGQLAT
jgi:hypothetical protein